MKKGINLNTLGKEWLIEQVEGLTDHIDHVTPSKFNEEFRYLPASVTSIPGYIRYSVNEFMREIVDNADVNSPVRETNLKKGVQITYSTVLESIAFYFMCHVKVLPMMYVTADKELAEARIENNFIPMLTQSDMTHIIRSSDTGNSRKTGMTKNHIQFEGGGYLVPFGSNNPNKMRQFSICVMMKDEMDGWPDIVGKDGDPDKLTDDRCKGYWERRKIFRGSTPTVYGTSKIEKAYLNGDQRKYMVNCKHCGHSQALRWGPKKIKTHGEEERGGFKWDMDEGILVLESVRYCCIKCDEPHYEHDKARLFSEKHGAHWKPTARPKEPGIRSYHLPAFYSPIGMAPWYSLVIDYLAGYDPETKKVIDIGKYQAFYNNVLAEPFKVLGDRIVFQQVSAHRRAEYRLGEIPNKYAAKWSGSHILFLTCQIDVHKHDLAVSVMGWCKESKPYVIDYWRFELRDNEDDCGEITSSVWGRVQSLIEEKEYIADDGKKYRITVTLIDSGYSNANICDFCSVYAEGVYPILGRDRPGKNQKISEFAEFKTQSGTKGYKILVDHYKDRNAPVLRRGWSEAEGQQKPYHFNAPVDITDAQLLELTKEVRREEKNERGEVNYVWHRPGNAKNELWDLLVYGHAAVEILAWKICIEHFELETIDWRQFWEYVEQEKLYFY